MTNGWDIATAIGTVGSMLFVAVQALYTRRAITVSQVALQPAQAMAIEATRARIDIEAPNLSVHLHTDSSRFFVQSSTSGGIAQPVAPTQQWHFPGRARESITLQALVTVTNLAEHSANLRLFGPLRLNHGTDPQPSPPPPMMVGHGQEIIFWIEAKFTAEEWAENWHAQQDDRDRPHVGRAVIQCTDTRDQGVVDTWHLWLTGCPIEPTPDKDALWQQTRGLPAPDPLTDALVTFDPDPPRERAYWISRSGGAELPSPNYAPGLKR